MGYFSSLAAAILAPSLQNKKRYRGAKGEAQAASGMALFLPSGYKILNDILIPTPRGTTQIDHVVLSNYGIFVIESKNVAGVIHGSAEESNWTVYRGRSEYEMFNPLFQNAGHITALAAVTRLQKTVFHSLVFFWSDDCQFKTPMPENVRQMGLCAYIKSKRRYLLSNADVRSAIKMIGTARLPSTKANLEAHIARLKKRT